LDDFNKKSSIKEKLAYLVSLNFPMVSPLPAVPIDRQSVINSINTYINNIDKHILKSQDYSENSINRISALNNFRLVLQPTEKTKLASI
jgi:hypothetical protein